MISDIQPAQLSVQNGNFSRSSAAPVDPTERIPQTGIIEEVDSIHKVADEAFKRPQDTEKGANTQRSVENGDKADQGDVKDSENKVALQQQQKEQQEIDKLKQRDREVRAHERAHSSVGGQHAGPPQLEYERGPNGVLYAVGGEVSINTSPVPDNPEATLAKAEQISRAALAPVDPSAQDRLVAAQAQGMAIEARAEIAEKARPENSESKETESDSNQQDNPTNGDLIAQIRNTGAFGEANASGNLLNIIA